MLIQNYIARFYDVNIEVVDEHETHLEIYERGEECEPLGWFVMLAGAPNCFQYRNVCGRVASGTAFNESQLRNAVRAREF